MRKQAPTIALNSVKTFARTMFQTLRLESGAKAFVYPAAMRSATCASVRPTFGSTITSGVSTSVAASMDHRL